MNPLIPLPQPDDKPISTTTSSRTPFPRGQIPTSEDMAATTLPPRTVPHSSFTEPFRTDRPQLPPLNLQPVWAANRSLQTPNSVYNGPGSPASSPSSGTSSHPPRAPLPFSSLQLPLPGTATQFSSDLSKEQGGDGNIVKPQLSRYGVKRTFDEIIPRRPPALLPQNPIVLPAPISNIHPVSAPTASPSPMSGQSPTLSSTSNLFLTHEASIKLAPDRFKLHLRQQPRAARAGPDGKDRRTIDPPPVLQLLIDDFDPQNEKDMAEMKSHSWVVHAKLISAQAPHEDVSTIPSQSDTFKGEVTRLLLGTTVSSPFFCEDDPDSERATKHPSTAKTPPPSPSSRFIKKSTENLSKSGGTEAYKKFPGAFFIFADLSIRKAGQYRLEFRLMKMNPGLLTPGSYLPMVAIAVTDSFHVVNAKDFDQVQPSTRLVKGLLDRGAGFPLKLKKGLREGQRRRARNDDSEDDEEGGDRDDDEDDDD